MRRLSFALPLVLIGQVSVAATIDAGRTWICLPERAVRGVVDGGARPLLAEELKALGQGGRCAAWLPLPDGRVSPGDGRTVVAVPEALSSNWSVVPLPLRTWGYSSVDEIESIVLQRDAAGIVRAQTARPKTRGQRASTPAAGERVLNYPAQVIDFARHTVGPSGNRFGTFAGRGERVVTRRSAGSRRHLVISTADSAQGGFGGLWIELASHRMLADPESGLDAARVTAVVIRGDGQPIGNVLLHDSSSSKRDAPFTVGSLSTAARNADGSWEWRGRIPEGVDRAHLRSLVLDLTGLGDVSVEIGDVWIASDDDVIPARQGDAMTVPSPSRRGLWVWNTAEILAAETPYVAFRDTLRTWAVTDVFLQLPYELPAMDQWSTGAIETRLALLVAYLHNDGLRVHALDGASFMATAPARSLVMAQARRIVRFNKHWSPDGAFDAVHLDIEPYTLPGFGGRRRNELLDSYLDVITGVKRAIAPIPLWLDIPFWYDEAEEVEVCDCGPARNALLSKLIEHADGIVVMAYRTSADGANGIAAHAFGELTMAEQSHKKALVGLETVPLPAEDQWHVTVGESVALAGGGPVALRTRGDGTLPYLLFSPSPTEADALWLKENAAAHRQLSGLFVRGPDPSTVTFHSVPRQLLESVGAAAIELLRLNGVRFDGIALHELRTLPTP